MITGLCSFWRVDGLRPTRCACGTPSLGVFVAIRNLTACLLVAVGAVLPVAGCQDRSTAERRDAGPPVVAVTIFPIGDIARALAGAAAEVVVILPAGASPATFEPTPDLARRLTGARLIVAVGAGADDWGNDMARTSGADFVSLTETMVLEYGNNPHVWLDPIVVRDAILPQLTEALIRAVPAEDASIRRRAATYDESLTALDDEIRATLSALESRAFVATHPAWPYFARRYGLRQVGVLYPSPGRELSPRELASLVDEARGAGVRAVFTEPQLGETGAQALANELGARIGMLDPLGGSGVSDRDSYVALLRFNAQGFATTLGGRYE